MKLLEGRCKEMFSFFWGLEVNVGQPWHNVHTTPVPRVVEMYPFQCHIVGRRSTGKHGGEELGHLCNVLCGA